MVETSIGMPNAPILRERSATRRTFSSTMDASGEASHVENLASVYIMRAKTSAASSETALALMQDTDFGLTSSVWTMDAAIAEAFVAGLAVGTCYVNWCNDVHAQVVWSGVGLSGNGNGAMGHEGFRVLTNPKSVVKRLAPMPFP